MTSSFETIRLKPTPFPVYISIATAIVFSLVNLTMTHDPSVLIVAIVMLVAGIIIWIVLNRIEITITSEGLTYKNISSTKSVSWNEVLKSYLKFYHRGKASSYYWHFVCTDQRTVKFSVRFFRRRSLRILAEAVIANLRTAEIDERIANMAEGVFPWRILW
jgi:hypothetical protein